MKSVEIVKTYHSFTKNEFEDYFSQRGTCKKPGCYSGEGWEVYIEEEKNIFVGSLKFVAVTLHLTLCEEIKHEFITHMKMSFLRGGG